MLSKKMTKALNDQINAEFYSSYLYLSMQAYFESKNLPGFANWMSCQVQEEYFHAMKMYNFINERGGAVKLDAIDKPSSEWESPLAVFTNVLEHEQKVTRLINKLADLAIEEKDHATGNFLQWYVNEQVEEEASADGVLQQLKLVQKNPAGLFMIDKELSTRVFAPPAKE